MQRDSDNMKDNAFDESAIKSMYDNQLNQLENLIATQRKAQMKMRDHIVSSEKRYTKVGGICAALQENLSSGFSTRSDTNLAVQPLKMARGLKVWI